MFLLPDFRVRQRDHLLNISRAITAQLDLGEVLRMVLQAATSMLAGEVGLIALREGEAYTIRAVIGLDLEHAHLFDPLLEELSRRPESEDDVLQFQARLRRVARTLNLNLRQVVSLPMIVADQMLGILFIFRSYAGSPGQNDYLLLQSFADQAAIAVSNARMYEFANQERQRLAAILDYSADGVMILDSELRIERWNRALSRMTGWQVEQVTGRPHDVVVRWKRREIGPDLAQAVAGGWPRRVNGDSPVDTLYIEGDLERLDGTLLSVGITYAPLSKPGGGLQNVIGNVRDITHFREAERLKSTFISVVSHELKTPVALIKGYADALSREDADWDQATIRNGLTVIEEEADRLTELIENLLAASKLQAEGMRLNLDDVSLATIAQQAIDRFTTQTDRHVLRAEFPPHFPVIQGDHTRLRQVVDNLLSNAIKYSPNGGTITLCGSFTAEQVSVSVSDEGIGLPPDQLQKVFERFYRVGSSLTHKAQGTGLGLYLAHAVITAHGGQIWAENNPGGGATFSFSLPRRE
ncbi:MAG: PAS domain S-box protein [Chloroflexi bacterium]|nr:PAS domain S-box protein [Chloroflexota bacterium]